LSNPTWARYKDAFAPRRFCNSSLNPSFPFTFLRRPRHTSDYDELHTPWQPLSAQADPTWLMGKIPITRPTVLIRQTPRQRRWWSACLSRSPAICPRDCARCRTTTTLFSSLVAESFTPSAPPWSTTRQHVNWLPHHCLILLPVSTCRA
jgi:hypothetical protein